MRTVGIARTTRRSVVAVLLTLCGVSTPPLGADEDLIPLPLKLPRAAFRGNDEDREHLPDGPVWPEERRKLPLVPRTIKQLALHRPVTASCPLYSGTLDQVTDGVKEAYEDTSVELRAKLQWIQIDLGASRKLYDLCLWHFHSEPVAFHDVVIQLSDDPEFQTGVTTLYNNDRDGSAGLGRGAEREYYETHLGLLVDCHAVQARYVRCYSHGSTYSDPLNRYTEVEVWGLPE